MMALVRAQEPVAHPRLLMRAGEEPKGVTEGLFKAADSVIVSFSRKTLKQPPVERTMIGRRLLHTSRTVLKRTFWLGYTYRVHGGEAYARRAIDEMLAASAFPDWNPSHFLDVGEMTMALAIGYDWLYDRMTPAERETVARAIIDKGLKPAGNKADAWFYRNENNWNSVCNAGMVYGALAVWEEDPEFCQSMLEKSLESNKLAYKAYAGGGYPEGYNYWGYGASFQIMLEAALDRAFKDGYVRSPEAEAGLAALVASADFIRFTRTPADHSYSFSDSYRRADGQYMQAWIFRHTGDASFLYPELRYMEASGYRRLCEDRLFPMFLIALGGDAPAHIDPPAGRYYQCGGTTPVFVYRSGWESQEDDYLGVKGGLAMSSHSHLDQGSFYFESDGVTWATDLGMQDYNSLETAGVDLWDMTQDSERWSVFRIGPFSHNILTVNGHTPKVNHPAAFSRTWAPEEDASQNRIGAEMDLTELYTEDLDSCKRAVYLWDENLEVMDLIQAGDSVCTVRWAMCTEAPDVSLHPNPRFAEPKCPEADQEIILRSGWHQRSLSAELLDKRRGAFPGPGWGPLDVEYHEGDFETSLPDGLPSLHTHIWPTTYDPTTPDVDGMQYLHETDAANPGKSLIGYTFTLQPHQKVVLHVRLTRHL